jgi:exonuclease III
VFILTETHTADDDEEREMFAKFFKDFRVFHVHAKEDGGRRLGVAIGVKKKKVEENDITIEKEEDGERRRWIVMTIKGMMAEPLQI